jgi:hypothetical protein
MGSLFQHLGDLTRLSFVAGASFEVVRRTPAGAVAGGLSAPVIEQQADHPGRAALNYIRQGRPPRRIGPSRFSLHAQRIGDQQLNRTHRLAALARRLRRCAVGALLRFGPAWRDQQQQAHQDAHTTSHG